MSPTTRLSVLAASTLLAVAYAPSCSSDDSTSPTTTGSPTSSSSATGSGGTSSSTSSSAGGSSGAGGSSTAATGGSAGSGGSGGAGTSAGGSGGSGGATSGGGGGAGGGGRGGSGGSAGSGGSGGAGGGAKDGGAGSGGTNGGSDGGMFTFTGDFAMMGNRLCFKIGNTGGTGQRSPAINWSGAPASTGGFIVSLKDLSNSNVHWMACKIPATTMGLPANVQAATLPTGAQQTAKWYGPGAGEVHQYQYKVWAMKDTSTNCNGLDQPTRNSLWTQLTNDEKGAKTMVIDSREIIAYGDTQANCM